MSNKYPLESLGKIEFQRLVMCLCRNILGAGVKPYGEGPDGGRDGVFKGTIKWDKLPASSDQDWSGYTVVAAKHQSRIYKDGLGNLEWLTGQLKSEIQSWKARKEKRPGTLFPEYLLFVANTPLTAAKGQDAIERFLSVEKPEMERLGLKDWKVWSRDDVVLGLDQSQDTRRAFAPLLTNPADEVLKRLESLELQPGRHSQQIVNRFGEESLKAERWIYFHEAGDDGGKSALSELVVDIPLSPPNEKHHALRSLLFLSERNLRGSVAGSQPRHLVLTGAPGSGKSTLARFLVQTHRAQMLRARDLSPICRKVVDDNTAALNRLGLSQSTVQRWPVLVDLPTWVKRAGVSGPEDLDLLPYLRLMINDRTGENLSTQHLVDWLPTWPWLLVLDGLDEVTSPTARMAVINAITNFKDQVDHRDADVMMVVTSRPAGYDQSLPSYEFAELKLGPFTKEQAYEYGRRTTLGRLGTDSERCSVVLNRFKEELKSESVERLARTPLQVLIITLILEVNRALPLTRYGLFSAHYERLMRREQNKDNHLADFLTTHEDSVTSVHEEVGLRLHVRVQDPEASDVLGMSELREIARQVFMDEGFKGSALDGLIEQLINAATNRLVLLVAGGAISTDAHTVTFELRTFQELMAARRLTSQLEDSSLKSRLVQCGPYPHWRNVFLLMIGRVFSRRQGSERDTVLDAIRTIDTDQAWPGWLMPMSPLLAAAALDDGIAAAAPKWRLDLIEQALNSVSKFPTPPSELEVIAAGLSAAAKDAEHTNLIRNALTEAHRGSAYARWTSSTVLREARWPDGFPTPNVWVAHLNAQHSAPGGVSMRDLIRTDNRDPTELPGDVLKELEQVSVRFTSDGQPLDVRTPTEPLSAWNAVALALTDADVAQVLRRLILSADRQYWLVSTLFARSVYTSMSRRPIDPGAVA